MQRVQTVQTLSRLAAFRHAPRRLNTTLASSPTNSLPPPVNPITTQRRPPFQPNDAEPFIGWSPGASIRGRLEDLPRDSADVLATIKYVEQVFGEVDEYFCGGDTSNRSRFLYIRFRNPDSVLKAKERLGAFMRIPAPLATSTPLDSLEGGVSLASLQSYLAAEDVGMGGPDYVEPPKKAQGGKETRQDEKKEFLYFQVLEPTAVRSAPVYPSKPYISRRAMRAFIKWSGFAPDIKPLPKDTPLLEHLMEAHRRRIAGVEVDKVDESTVDHPIMRHAVRRYVKMFSKTKVPNPLEIDEEKVEGTSSASPTSAPAVEEEPLVEIPIPELDPIVDEIVVEEEDISTPSPPAQPTPQPRLPQKHLQQVDLTRSPEAQAQLRLANSVLKNIQKSKVSSKQSSPKPLPKPVVGKRPIEMNQKKHQSPQQKGSSLSSKLRAQHQKTKDMAEKGQEEKKETDKRQEEQKETDVKEGTDGTTNKIRGFMGRWF